MLNKHLIKKLEEYNLLIKYSINNKYLMIKISIPLTNFKIVKFLSIPKTKFYLKQKIQI